MEGMMALFIGLIAVVLIFGLPVAVVGAIAYIYVKRRNFVHEERLKMIENGLVSGEGDLHEKAKSLNTSSTLDWKSLLFYPIIFWYTLLFMAYFVFVLFYALFVKNSDGNSAFLIWTMIGIVASAVFTVFIKVLPIFNRNKGLFFLGMIFLAFMWTALFMRQVTSVSMQQVKNKFSSVFNTGNKNIGESFAKAEYEAGDAESGVQTFEVKEPEESELDIENINGSISVSTWNSNKVEFQYEKGSKSGTKIYFKENGNKIRAWVEIDEGESVNSISSLLGSLNSEYANFKVKIPSSLHKVLLESVNGEIKVAVDSGKVNVETVNGSINIKVSKKLTGNIDVEAVNGTVQLNIPEKSNAKFNIATVVGAISTSLPLSVNRNFMSSELKGSLGVGGPKVNVETVNGAIKLN